MERYAHVTAGQQREAADLLELGAVPPVVVADATATAADSKAAHVKHSTKQQDKTNVATKTTERQHGKVKAKSQNAHGHGSKSHKSK